MANVYEHTLDTNDFSEEMWWVRDTFKMDNSTAWEKFLCDTAKYAAEDCPDSVNISVRSRFEDFLYLHGYNDKIAYILYEAMKAFVNERISETGADFDFI